MLLEHYTFFDRDWYDVRDKNCLIIMKHHLSYKLIVTYLLRKDVLYDVVY